MKNASRAERRNPDIDGTLRRAAAIVRHKSRQHPRLGIILGSGFQGLLKVIQATAEFPYSRLPGFPTPAVAGHVGTLTVGSLGNTPIVVLNGRAHYYEGHDMRSLTRGVRLLALLGIESVLITNAAGGINPRLRPGDFMMLTDHINFMGANPLRGRPEPGRSSFVDMTQAYDPGLQALLRRAARRARVSLRGGVYLAVSGPSYETPAEIRAFRRLGADAVGMSTVPEVLVARQQGLRVAGLSCITNPAAGIGDKPLDHKQVLETAVRASRQAARLLKEFAELYITEGRLPLRRHL